MSANETEIVLEYTHFGEIGQQMAREIDVVCGETAKDIKARAALAIQNPPKSGRIYRRGTVAHQASAPGEAPATDIGALASNVTVKREAPSDWVTTWHEEYAATLEFGTLATDNIAARPFIRPAVEAVRKAFIAAIKRIVER